MRCDEQERFVWCIGSFELNTPSVDVIPRLIPAHSHAATCAWACNDSLRDFWEHVHQFANEGYAHLWFALRGGPGMRELFLHGPSSCNQCIICPRQSFRECGCQESLCERNATQHKRAGSGVWNAIPAGQPVGDSRTSDASSGPMSY